MRAAECKKKGGREMSLPSEFIDELKYRNNIEEVIGTYVTLKRAGSNFNGLCPFHNERTPSFTVFPATRSFYCFGCGAGGDVISFVMRMENLDYPSAVEQLAKRAGLEVPQRTAEERSIAEKRTRMWEMNREAARFFHEQLYSPAGKAGLDYLTGRGLSGSVIKHFGLGYAPNEFGLLTDHLRSKGFHNDEMVEGFLAGLSKKTGRPYDYFRGRVMFPIIDTAGNVIAFGGRVLDDSKPKYLNSSDTPAFKKSRNLFALNFARAKCAESMILCEGYMDVIALHAAGFENAVATLGTAITPEHARIMAKYTKCVHVAYDMDGAGRTAAEKAINLLTGVGLEVRVLKMEGAKDPDEYVKKFGASRFRNLLEGSAGQMEYRIDAILQKHDLSQFDDKMKAVQELVTLLCGVYSDVERDAYCSRLAARLEISPDGLRSDIRRQMRRRAAKGRREETRTITAELAGFGDRVNPDRARYNRASGAEDAILGILFLFPELCRKAAIGYGNEINLSPDDFLTEFNRMAYERFLKVFADTGRFDLSYLTEELTPEQLGRLTSLCVRRQQLSANDETVLLESIRTLREEAKKKTNSESPPSGESLAQMLEEKRKREKKPYKEEK